MFEAPVKELVAGIDINPTWIESEGEMVHNKRQSLRISEIDELTRF